MNTFENVLAQRETVSQSAVAAGKRQTSHGRIRVKAAEAVDFVLAAVFAVIGGGLWYFGFHLLDIRAKNLGYINVTVALAVIAGAAFIAVCVAAAVRGARRIKAKKN